MIRISQRAVRHSPMRGAFARCALVAVTALSAVAAIGGGIGLATTGIGMTREHLVDTPFDSYTIPALLLAIVVGGTMASAAIAAWRGYAHAGALAIGAGTVMLGWISVESLMIHEGRMLQIAVAALSLITIGLGVTLHNNRILLL